jgi:hypothetical protein
MFTVILAVAALADYVIIVYCILNMVSKPAVKTAEIPKDISEGYLMGHINNDKEFNAYIEEQNYRIALLSLNVEEILSNIDAIIERNKEKQGVMLG